MSLDIVAVVDRVPAALPADVRAIGDGPYLLVTDGSEATPSAERLLARHALLETVSQETSCLPCRYGGTLAGDADALSWLAERRDQLCRALARIGGRSEVDLHLRSTREEVGVAEGGGPGARYLRAAAARFAVVDEALLDRVAQTATSRLAGDSEVVVDREGAQVAFLVPRGKATTFLREARAAGLEGTLPDGIAARWSGPWPAYTFAAAWLGGGK